MHVVFSVYRSRIVVCSYLGLNQPRIEGDEYLQVVDEFVAAVKARWPKVLIQVRETLITAKEFTRSRALLVSPQRADTFFVDTASYSVSDHLWKCGNQ